MSGSSAGGQRQATSHSGKICALVMLQHSALVNVILKLAEKEHSGSTE